MQRRGPEEEVGDEIEAVEQAARDIGALEVLEGVDLVGDEQQARGSRRAGGTRGPRARRRQEAHGHADQQQVGDRIGEADGQRQRVELAADHLWLDQEGPRQDRRGGRQDRRVEQAAAVAVTEAPADQQEQPERR